MALACTIAPMPKQAMAPKMAKHVPSHFQRGPRPFLMKYMAPPTQLPAGVFSRKCTESRTSANFVIMPTRAVTHIQKRAPGPPMAMAVATPTILPVPISAARAVMRAFQGESSPCADWFLRPAHRHLYALTQLRKEKNFSPTVRYRPVPPSITSITGPQTKSLMLFNTPSNPSIFPPVLNAFPAGDIFARQEKIGQGYPHRGTVVNFFLP